MYVSIYLYIYTRNAWALPRRCSVEVSHSQTNVDATSQIPMGKTTKALGNIKLPPPLNIKFLSEKTKVLGNIKLPPQLNFTFNWEDQQRY